MTERFASLDCSGLPLYSSVEAMGACGPFDPGSRRRFCTDQPEAASFMVLYADAACTPAALWEVSRDALGCHQGYKYSCANASAGPPLPLAYPPPDWAFFTLHEPPAPVSASGRAQCPVPANFTSPSDHARQLGRCYAVSEGSSRMDACIAGLFTVWHFEGEKCEPQRFAYITAHQAGQERHRDADTDSGTKQH